MNVQDAFGVVDQSCHDGFDFTLLFEEAILTMLPLGLSSNQPPLRLLFLPRFALSPSGKKKNIN